MRRVTVHIPPGALLLIVGLLVPASAAAETADELVAALLLAGEGTRMQAATRLYHLGLADRGVPPLVGQLRAEDPDERCLAARLLGMLRSVRAVPPLVTALGDADWAVRRDAVEALGQIGAPAAARNLAGRLGDPHARVRIAAVRALREVRVTDALPDALEREADPEVRLHLVEALLADPSPRGERALQRALGDVSELVRLLAATGLVTRGEVRAVGVIAQRLSLSSVTARTEAVEALGRATGPAAPAAVQVLAPMLDDASWDVRRGAAAALARLGDPRGVETLRAASRGDASAPVRARALELLGQLEGGGSPGARIE